ncbi:MAG TPA: TIR domain-containing protein [Candidatus Sulfopaludibacter sp.]|jgi:small GTP-binding protein|nr:TIR domain-containing protein [Candidatus Sulfopaludibacter sp.]
MWDVFISHASEDKKDVVEPLTRILTARGLSVWYDDTTLLLGDSLHRKIDEGLAGSRYGVVVLSKSFFAKNWPQQELSGLAARESGGSKVILPVWHEMRHSEILQYSPLLADRLGISTENGLEVVATEILKVVQPSTSVPQRGDEEAGHSTAKRKVCIVGAAGVGKTSLVQRFVSSIFSPSYLTTVGVKIDKKIVTLEGHHVMMMLWDTAGEEEGVRMDLKHVRGAHGLIIVADGCRAPTLDTALDLRNRIYDKIGRRPTALAVNKFDLYSEWQIKRETLESLSANSLATFITSAATGKGVPEMFTHLARTLLHGS